MIILQEPSISDPRIYFLAEFPGFGSTLIDVDIIENALDSSFNVWISTVRGIEGDDGDIFVTTDIIKTWGGDARLTLEANDDVYFDKGVVIRSYSGRLDVELIALGSDEGGRIVTTIGSFQLNGGEVCFSYCDLINTPPKPTHVVNYVETVSFDYEPDFTTAMSTPALPKGLLQPSGNNLENVEAESISSIDAEISVEQVDVRVSDHTYKLGDYSYTLVDQHDANIYSDGLYDQADINADGSPSGYEVNQLACLAAVYLMIERAKGDAEATIGASDWDDRVGAINHDYASGGIDYSGEAAIISELDDGNPVIIQLKDSDVDGVLQNHFVLLVSYKVDEAGNLIAEALDPLNGEIGTLKLSSAQYESPTLGDAREAYQYRTTG